MDTCTFMQAKIKYIKSECKRNKKRARKYSVPWAEAPNTGGPNPGQRAGDEAPFTKGKTELDFELTTF